MRDVTVTVLVCTAILWGDAVMSAELPMGTAFTYQGRLLDGGDPANGEYDFEFVLCGNDFCFDSMVTLENVDVINGLFTVEIDFGDDPNQFNGEARWLDIHVRPGDSTGAFTALSPMQELTPTPYAIHSAQAGDADTVDGQHGCTRIIRTGYSETGDYETGSTAMCSGYPKGCTIRLISTRQGSGQPDADNGEAFGFYNQNWYAVDGGWRVVAMTSASPSVQTAVGVNGDGTAETIMSAGSCTLKDDSASHPSQTTWVVSDNSTTYECWLYVCD